MVWKGCFKLLSYASGAQLGTYFRISHRRSVSNLALKMLTGSYFQLGLLREKNLLLLVSNGDRSIDKHGNVQVNVVEDKASITEAQCPSKSRLRQAKLVCVIEDSIKSHWRNGGANSNPIKIKHPARNNTVASKWSWADANKKLGTNSEMWSSDRNLYVWYCMEFQVCKQPSAFHFPPSSPPLLPYFFFGFLSIFGSVT